MRVSSIHRRVLTRDGEEGQDNREPEPEQQKQSTRGDTRVDTIRGNEINIAQAKVSDERDQQQQQQQQQNC